VSVSRNDPCPCGSGKKYKNCCQKKESSGRVNRKLAAAIGIVVVLGAAWAGSSYFFGKPDPQTPPAGQVWSEEHGHYHDAPTTQPLPTATGSSTPPGPAPPGKVWSAEHGHWHDAPGSTQLDSTLTTKQDLPPPGKVWSDEHGHYHDAPPDSVSSE